MACCKCCCEGKSPPGECCGIGPTSTCCEYGEYCCNDILCCYTNEECCGELCCPEAEACCNSTHCCPDTGTCCGEICCTAEQACCGDTACCEADECCVDGVCVACDCTPPCSTDNCEECVEVTAGVFECQSLCAEGQNCCDGVCQDAPCVPPCDPPCSGCSDCVDGECVSTCAVDEFCCDGVCQAEPCDPPCEPPCDGCSDCIDGGCVSSCGEGQNCCNGTCQEAECCCDCLTLTGPTGDVTLYEPAIFCQDQASTQDSDATCTFTGAGDINWLTSNYGSVFPGVIASYSGSPCKFAVVGSVQQRYAHSEGLNETGECVCYLVTSRAWYRYWAFIHRCSGVWENIGSSVMITSAQGDPSDCASTWTNGNPPPYPAEPAAPACEGPWTGCGNEFP